MGPEGGAEAPRFQQPRQEKGTEMNLEEAVYLFIILGFGTAIGFSIHQMLT
jgi:hypothetical protein